MIITWSQYWESTKGGRSAMKAKIGIHQYFFKSIKDRCLLLVARYSLLVLAFYKICRGGSRTAPTPCCPIPLLILYALSVLTCAARTAPTAGRPGPGSG